jgi:hypothetical protein
MRSLRGLALGLTLALTASAAAEENGSLGQAVAARDLRRVAELLERQPWLLEEEDNGPLYQAAFLGYQDVADLLLSHGGP